MTRGRKLSRMIYYFLIREKTFTIYCTKYLIIAQQINLFSMDRERSTIWLTLTCGVLCILVAMHDHCFAGEVGIHNNECG